MSNAHRLPRGVVPSHYALVFTPDLAVGHFEGTADIDAKIRAGDMSPNDPVYVRLEGAPANGAFNVTRVAQVGSPTPVRDCPMTGTTTQG